MPPVPAWTVKKQKKDEQQRHFSSMPFVKLRYDWPVEDIRPHVLVKKPLRFITLRFVNQEVLLLNELRDLKAEFLSMVCSDIEIEPVLQNIFGEHLNRGSNEAQDSRLDIHARGFWQRNRSALFDVRVCHPNAVLHTNLEPQQIYCIYENEKKRLYSRRDLDIEHGTFTPLVYSPQLGEWQGSA